MAVIGVVTIFQGLIGICVDRTGPIIYRPSLLENVYNSIDDCHQGHRKSIIVAFWVSGNFSSRHDCRVAWSIAKNDGKVYCWSVPCTNAECRHRSIVEPSVRNFVYARTSVFPTLTLGYDPCKSQLVQSVHLICPPIAT